MLVLMAVRAEGIARVLQFGLVRIVAVGAPNPLVIHLALNVGTVNVDLVQNLSVRVIRLWGKKFQSETIFKRVAGEATGFQHPSA